MDNPRSYSPHAFRKVDNLSQVSNYSANSTIPIKPIELLCNLHTDQPTNNYCVEGKCFQPLCSQCIQGHLLHHKKNGYSDLSVKSMRAVRRECVGKLTGLIDELIKRLEQLSAPPSPQKLVEELEVKLQMAQKEAHDIIQQEFLKIRESLRTKINQSTVAIREMSDIHQKLQSIVEQLKESCAILADGKRSNMSIPDCIKTTLTLNEQALIDSFEKQGLSYENRRKRVQFQVVFNPQIFRAGLLEAMKISSAKPVNPASQASFSRPKLRNSPQYEESNQWDNSNSSLSLPVQAEPQQNNRYLHFFETGSNRLHLLDVQNRKKIGEQRVVSISEFIVPSFHASIVSHTGEFIYLSGGLVQLNAKSKSPLFMRYNIKTQVTKKDFAKVIPRSSHTLCQDKNGDIFILGGYGQSEREDESLYLTSVERVNQRTGKVEIQTDSRWGGSNISFRCRDMIVKACDQGIELYNQKAKQWITADIRLKSYEPFIFFKSAGFATINDSDFIIFGGYEASLQPVDKCFYWKIATDGRPTVFIQQLACKLPFPEGFDNGKAVVDQRGCFALQNIEDDQESCVDNQRRLLRFDLKEGGGDWRSVQIIGS